MKRPVFFLCFAAIVIAAIATDHYLPKYAVSPEHPTYVQVKLNTGETVRALYQGGTIATFATCVSRMHAHPTIGYYDNRYIDTTTWIVESNYKDYGLKENLDTVLTNLSVDVTTPSDDGPVMRRVVSEFKFGKLLN